MATGDCYDTVTYKVWYSWNSGTETTSTTSTDCGTWGYWNETSATCVTTSATWTHWNESDTVYEPAWVTWISAEELDRQKQEERHRNRLERRRARAQLPRKERRRQQQLEEQQLKLAQAREQDAKRQQKIEERRKKKAEATAWKLLEDVITAEQAKVYKKTGRLLVHGQQYDWLIKKPGYEGGKPGVVRVEKGKLTDICIHTNEGRDYELPEADRIVSLALSAKFNEKAFDKECNKHGSVQMPDEYLKECANF